MVAAVPAPKASCKVPFFAASIIAFVAHPLMRLLGKIKIKDYQLPNWLKSALVLVAFVFIIFSAVKLLIPTVLKQADIISQIDTNVLIDRLEPQMASIMKWITYEKTKELVDNLKFMIKKQIHSKILTIHLLVLDLW